MMIKLCVSIPQSYFISATSSKNLNLLDVLNPQLAN